MLKAIKIRLYPTKLQQEMLNKHFNACRFIYNSALDYKQTLYKDYKIKKSKIDIINELVDVKQGFPWLMEVKAETLQNVIDNVDNAFKGFYKGKGYPKFKSKKANQSFTSKQNFKLNSKEIYFYREWLKYKCSDRDKQLLQVSKIKKVTYSKNNINQYFASILVEFNPIKLKPLVSEVGIDLGLKYFLITSDGEYIDNPTFLRKQEKQLARQQRKLSRKQTGSNNRNKQRLKVARLHNKITRQRNYFLHNVSNKLINENQVIYIETLQVKNMVKNHKLAKSIHDVSWGSLVQMLSYKADWYGRQLVKIGTFEPSSKICNNCGCKKEDLKLSDRTYSCPICGYEECRDLNAAKNIIKIGRNCPESTLVESSSIESHGSKKKANKILEQVY
jgi:putative transposase